MFHNVKDKEIRKAASEAAQDYVTCLRGKYSVDDRTFNTTLKGRGLYANAGGLYHIAAGDWIRSGLAACGADIRRPGFSLDGYGDVLNDSRVCRACKAAHVRAIGVRP